MKVLFACHRFPYPPNRGGKIRPFNIIRHLSQRHEVFVASVAHTEEERGEGAGLGEFCEEIFADVVKEKKRWGQAVAALPSLTPSSVAYFRSAALARTVQAAAKRIRFDRVIVHCAFAAQYVSRVDAPFRVIDFGDLDSGKWFDYSRARRFPYSWGYFLEGHKLRRYERGLAAAFDHCTVTTPGESEEFKKLSMARPHSVVPNGVDGDYFHAVQGVPESRPIIIFLGRMDYYPNADAVVYFTRDIFPAVRTAVPQAELKIVGSSPTAAVKQLADNPGVTVTGYVPDVRPFLQEAAVSVAPLRMARGTQNKILESMAFGVPVVATPEAAKGIQACAGVDLLVAGNSGEFAQRVVQVLVDSELRGTLSRNGRARVQHSHSWGRSMEMFAQLIETSVD